MYALQKSVYDAAFKLTAADTVIEVGGIKKPRHLSEVLRSFNSLVRAFDVAQDGL